MPHAASALRVRGNLRVRGATCPQRSNASGLPTSLPSCTERRMALLDELRNSSILMLGDSTSAQLLMHSCDAFSSSPKSFVAVPQDVDLGKYHHGACDRSTTTRADCSGTAPEAASPSAPFRTLA